MGNTSYRQTGVLAPPDPRAVTQADFPKFIFGERIGNGKFLKSYQMKADGAMVVVKVYMKLSDEELALVTARLSHISRVLSPRKYPFLLPYQMWLKSNARVTRNMLTPTYLVRQYFKANVYDRLATRPFLDKMEKYWIIYQLLRAVEVVHGEGLYHGDMKPENIMVTSWSWLVLTDFASYKPITIPENDPTDFQYFFESSGRRRCYIAPERFVKRSRRDVGSAAGGTECTAQGDLRLMENDGASRRWTASAGSAIDDRSSRVTIGALGLDSAAALKAMDVFALGCTIAEILMDGVPLIDLPGILRYHAPLEEANADATSSAGDKSPSAAPGGIGMRYMDRLDHEMSPAVVAIQRIKDPTFREAVCMMTSRNPDHRPTVSEVIQLLGGAQVQAARCEKQVDPSVFPSFFSQYLYDFFLSVHWQGMLPDTRVAMLCQNYANIMKEITGEIDTEGMAFFRSCYEDRGVRGSNEGLDPNKPDKDTADQLFQMSEPPAKYRASVEPVSGGAEKGSVSREDVTKEIYGLSVDQLLARCESLLGLVKVTPANDASGNKGKANDLKKCNAGKESSETRTQVEQFLNRTSLLHPPRAAELQPGLIIVLEFICANIRHLRYPHSRIASLIMLLRMAAYSNSETILQRIVPFMLLSMSDVVPSVRALAVRTLCSMLYYVDEFLPHERLIFIKSIFPALNAVSRDSEITVRVAFVECIGKYAELSKLFLDKAHSLQMAKLGHDRGSSVTAAESTNGATDGQENSSERVTNENDDMEVKLKLIKTSYDADLKELHTVVTRWVTAVLLDQHGMPDAIPRAGSALFSTSTHSSLCKKILLTDIVRLCGFFGTELTLDVLLSQLLTFLNDQDWELRLAFCGALPGVCAFLGETFTSNFIYPCIENALVDVEVMVVCKALEVMTSLIQLKLFTDSLIEKTLQLFACLVVHPVTAVRIGAIDVVSAAYEFFGPIGSYTMLRPSLLPILEYDIFASGEKLTKAAIVKALQPAVSTSGYRAAMQIKRNQLVPGSAVSAVSLNPSKPVVRMDPGSKGSVSSGNLNSVGGGVDANSVILETADQPPPPTSDSQLDSVGSLNESQFGDSVGEIKGEEERLEAMASYIEQASYEMNTKTLQWRNASNNHGHGQNDEIRSPYLFSLDAKAAAAVKNNSRILDIPTHGLVPESSIRWLRIPHQKFSVNIGISEDMRLLAKDTARLAEDPLLIHKIYGIRKDGDVYGDVEGAAEGTPVANGNTDSGLIVNPANLPSNRPMSMAVMQGITKARTNTLASAVGSKSFDISSHNRSSKASQEFSGASKASVAPAKDLLSIAGSSVDEAPETSDINSSLYVANALSELSGTDVRLRLIKALKVPPLPRNMGSLRQPDGREFSMFTEQLDMSAAIDPQSRALWRPKDAVQLASMTEHSQAVTRLTVAQDQSFFVSASADKTARVWQISGLENNAYPRSSLTYAMHTGRLTDVAPIENSHSVATSCDDGSVHVWRVDVAKRSIPSHSAALSSAASVSGTSGVASPNGPGSRSSLSVSGMSEIRNLPPSEGGVVCLQHFNGDSASVLTYCTTRGAVKSWDLRCSSEPFNYRMPPELGFPTSMTMAPDKNWMCVGTSKGCVALWDIRYNVMNKLWQHSSASSIHRLASCKTITPTGPNRNSRDYPEGAYLFLAAGRAEAAVWGLPEGGECLRCYRTVPSPPCDSASVPTYHSIDALPVLHDIPLMSGHARYGSVGSALKPAAPLMEPSVRTVIGRISATGASYIITAGSDRYIRFWDFSNHANCFTVSGLDSAQPRHQYATPDLPAFRKKLFLCFDTAVPTSEQTLQAHLPARENRGLINPPVGFKSGILDLKVLDLPTRMMLTAGRDGEIKLLK